MKIHEEDQYNDCYGRERMYLALQQRKDAGKTDIDIPCEATVRKVMVQIGLIHKPRRKPNGITKADRLAQKSDDLLRRDFYADRPLKKAVTDISEVKANDGKLYVSAIFDCFDLMPLGIAIEDNMRASLCCHTLHHIVFLFPLMTHSFVFIILRLFCMCQVLLYRIIPKAFSASSTAILCASSGSISYPLGKLCTR